MVSDCVVPGRASPLRRYICSGLVTPPNQMPESFCVPLTSPPIRLQVKAVSPVMVNAQEEMLGAPNTAPTVPGAASPSRATIWLPMPGV